VPAITSRGQWRLVVLEPGMIPKTPSGKLRRAHALALVN